MLMREEREIVVEYGKKISESGLVTGTGGNISVYNPGEGLMAISPSGMDYFETKPKDIVLVNLAGETVEGRRKPSSEVGLHRIFYARRDDIRAVVHTHSLYCTILATLRRDLPASNYYIALAGGKNVRCSDYATFGTAALAESAVKAAEDRYACLLANHGQLACSKDLPSAFNISVELERMAEIHYKASLLGTPVILADDEVERLLGKFRCYGQVTQK